MKLVYAATKRCQCGYGLAYDPKGESGRPIEGYWDCAAILLGEAIPSGQPGSVQHTGRLPFLFYEIKSEKQPSANGATTREPRRRSDGRCAPGDPRCTSPDCVCPVVPPGSAVGAGEEPQP